MNIHWCIVKKGIITSHYKWDPKAHTWKERKERKRRGWEEGGREGEERKRRKSQKKACKLRSGDTSGQCSRSVVSDSLRPHKLQPGMLQLPEFTQTRVHWVSDAIQLSQPLSSPSPPALNLSQHQGLFKWVRSSHQVAKILEFKLNISPFIEYPGLISFRIDWLDLLAVQGTLESSPAPQFKSINSSALSFLDSPTFISIHDYWENHSHD